MESRKSCIALLGGGQSGPYNLGADSPSYRFGIPGTIHRIEGSQFGCVQSRASDLGSGDPLIALKPAIWDLGTAVVQSRATDLGSGDPLIGLGAYSLGLAVSSDRFGIWGRTHLFVL